MSHSEPYQNLISDFRKFINQDGNNSIILSAPFGSGKTHFIRAFQEIHKDDYHYFTIHPVYYSISNNQDVFELIKYDILIQILANAELAQSIDRSSFHWTLTMQMFALDLMKPDKLISKLASVLQHNEEISLKVLGDTIKEMQAYHQKMNINDSAVIDTFLKSIENQKGTAYEFDAVSQVISACLLEQRKKALLIIDDFDRLDPEHVFRILNLLISYNDQVANKNKLGFSKVLLICDVENIRSIFHHKYGDNTDFSGYLDKFYSKGVYEFNNLPFASEIIQNHLETIRFKFNDLDPIAVHKNADGFRSLNEVVVFLVLALFHKRVINLRAILKLDIATYNQYTKPFVINFLSLNIDGFAVWVLLALSELFPSKQVFLEVLGRLADEGINNNEIIFQYEEDQIENLACRLSEFCLALIIPSQEINKNYSKVSDDNDLPRFVFQSSLNERQFIVTYSVFIGGIFNTMNIRVETFEEPNQLKPSYRRLGFHLLYEAALKLLRDN